MPAPAARIDRGGRRPAAGSFPLGTLPRFRVPVYARLLCTHPFPPTHLPSLPPSFLPLLLPSLPRIESASRQPQRTAVHTLANKAPTTAGRSSCRLVIGIQLGLREPKLRALFDSSGSASGQIDSQLPLMGSKVGPSRRWLVYIAAGPAAPGRVAVRNAGAARWGGGVGGSRT